MVPSPSRGEGTTGAIPANPPTCLIPPSIASCPKMGAGIVAKAKPKVTGFYDKPSGSIQYVAACEASGKCAIIDPVLNFDEKSGATSTSNADAILAFVKDQGLQVDWILDTHPHADHFSAADYLKQKTGAPKAIGEKITDVQTLWKVIYNWPDFHADGSQWDRLFADGDMFRIGEVPGKVMHSPGHTLASVTYVAGDAAFIHDTMFMPDSGTARADFPGGSAARLWQSIQAILSLPDDTRLFTGHDYEPNGRAARWEIDRCRAAGDEYACVDNAHRRPSSSSCARRGTRRCRCRGRSSMHCRST